MEIEKLLLKYRFFKTSSTTPRKRVVKRDWYNCFKEHQENILQANPTSIILGDSIAVGLSRYLDIWSVYFKDTCNLGISGDCTENVLWRAENLDFNQSIKNVILFSGTNNIEQDSPYDIANSIICSALVILKKNKNILISISGILPRDLDKSYIRSIAIVNKILADECKKLSNYAIKFIKPALDCTDQNGDIISKLFWIDRLHLSRDGNLKLAKSIFQNIQPNTISYSNPSYVFQHQHTGIPLSSFSEFPPLPQKNISILSNSEKNHNTISFSNVCKSRCKNVSPTFVNCKIVIPIKSSVTKCVNVHAKLSPSVPNKCIQTNSIPSYKSRVNSHVKPVSFVKSGDSSVKCINDKVTVVTDLHVDTDKTNFRASSISKTCYVKSFSVYHPIYECSDKSLISRNNKITKKKGREY